MLLPLSIWVDFGVPVAPVAADIADVGCTAGLVGVADGTADPDAAEGAVAGIVGTAGRVAQEAVVAKNR